MRPNIEYVKSEMERRQWTGGQLALKMGVSRMEVSRLLRGKRVGGKKLYRRSYQSISRCGHKGAIFFRLSGTYCFHLLIQYKPLSPA